MWLNPQFAVDLVKFTEENLRGKLHFMYIASIYKCIQSSFATSDWYEVLPNYYPKKAFS